MKIIILTIAAILSLNLSGCKNPTNDARRDLNRYLDYNRKGETEQAWDYISSRDRSVPSRKFDDYVKYNVVPRIYNKAFPRKYTIIELTINGDTATATVQITMPVCPPSADEFVFSSMQKIFEAKTKETDIIQELTTRYPVATLASTTTTTNYTLVKETAGWRIFQNWEGQEKAKEKEKNEKIAYAQNYLHLYDIEVEHYADDSMTFVKGWIRNDGPKTASGVNLTCYLLDNNGQDFAHDVSGVGEDIKPHHQKNFNTLFQHTPVPGAWKKKVRIEVSDLDVK